MTKEELRDYCYSIGLVDIEVPKSYGFFYKKGYRYNGQFVRPIDYIAAWDEEKQCVVVAKSCVIDEDFSYEKYIRMDGSYVIQNDEEIKASIDDLIKSVQEKIKSLKLEETKKRIKKMEGDFK